MSDEGTEEDDNYVLPKIESFVKRIMYYGMGHAYRMDVSLSRLKFMEKDEEDVQSLGVSED